MAYCWGLLFNPLSPLMSTFRPIKCLLKAAQLSSLSAFSYLIKLILLAVSVLPALDKKADKKSTK